LTETSHPTTNGLRAAHPESSRVWESEGIHSDVPKIAVVTDSSANLPAQLVAESGITVVPILLTYGGETYRDGIDVQPDQLYEWLRANKHVPGTASPSAGDFLRVFADLGERGVEAIVTIVPPARLSGTFNSALTAAQSMVGPPVKVIQTGTVAMGQGFAALEAARAVAAGADLEGAIHRASEVAGKVELLAAIDTLEYLRRGGRIGAVGALFGQALHVKPVLCVVNGKVELFARVRTQAAAVRRMLEQMTGQLGDRPAHVAVLHADVPEAAEELRRVVDRQFRCVQLLTTQLTPTMGAHTGPGVLGVVYYAD
jgi:DegV family protein with EDD domain